MKRFKKVLALVLAGVLALAMLTACDGGTTDPDKIMPDDGTVEVVMTINNTAANKGLGQVEYSAKYSAVTKALLENWLEWRNDGSNTKYRENYDKITAELGNVKIVVGLTKDTTPLAAQANYNPATRTSFKYDSLFKDESAFNLAEKIGVAYVTTSNGTVYQASVILSVSEFFRLFLDTSWACASSTALSYLRSMVWRV